MRYTYTGRIHEIGEERTFASGFRKRDFVCATTRDKYTDYAVFSAVKDLGDKVATLKPGDEVTVEFVLDGRKWETRWFSSLTALKVELAKGANAGSINAKPEPAKSQEMIADDLPF